MGFRSYYLLCLIIFLAVSSSIHALDIAKLLGDKADYATFNKYLTEAKLVDQINSRKTVTVLVVNNAECASLSGKSPEAIKAIIGTHVLLDYYDEKNLVQDIIGRGQPLTSLDKPVKVALIGEGSIAFGSAASGAPAPDAEIVQPVLSQPSEYSIIEVSKLIVAPGSDSKTPASPSTEQSLIAAKTPTEGATAPAASTKAPAASAKAPAASAKAPVPTEGAKPPASTKSAEAPTDDAKAPTKSAEAPTDDAKAPTKSAEAPTDDAKADAPTTGAETPSSKEVTAPSPSEVATDSPAVAPTVSPAADVGSPSMTPGPGGEAAAADAATPSSSSRTIVGLVGAVMCFASILVVM